MLTLLDLEPGDLRPMTGEETETMAYIVLASRGIDWSQPKSAADDDWHTVLGAESEEKLPFVIQVMLQRLRGACPVIGISPEVLLWTASMVDRVGIAVLWAHALWTCAKNKVVEATVVMDDLVQRKFATGVPTDEAYRRVWDSQKSPGAPLGNLLDTEGAWTI